MPTSRRKSSTCLTISPWKTVRRGSDRQQPTSDSSELETFRIPPAQSESTLQHNQNEEFRSGIAELIKNEQLMVRRFAKELDHEGPRGRRAVGILAFEKPSGNFFGALLDNTFQTVASHITGEVIESSLQNCGHYEIGCEYYSVYISDADSRVNERQLMSMAVNSGGDAARLTSVDVDETTTKDKVAIMFQCLQLYTNESEDSCFTKYFSHCSVSDDIIVNIGIMDVHP